MRRSSTRVVGTVAVSLLALSLVACSDSGNSATGPADPEALEAELEDNKVGAMENYAAGQTFVATEPVEFSMLYRDHPNYPIKDDWLLFTHIEDQNKVSLDITSAPLSDYEQRRSLLIGAGDAPDVITVTYPGQEAPFVASGAILPISDYVHLMPNFQQKIKDWDLNSDLDTIRQADGKYYMLPGIYEQMRYDYSIGLRTDILEDLGLEEPATWDEFRSVLEAIKKEKNTKYVFSDRWKGEALLNVAAASFNTVAGWGFGGGTLYDESKDEFYFAGSSDDYKTMVEYFAGLVQDGLLDPESFTQEDDQADQKLANEQSFAITTNGQELLRERTVLEATKGDDFTLDKIRVPSGPAGDNMRGARLENGFMISNDAKDNDNFVAMLQFLDWLYYSDEGLEFVRWGVEGETFAKDTDGNRILDDGIEFMDTNVGADKHFQADYGFFNGAFSLAHGSTEELVLTHVSDEEKAWAEGMANKTLLPANPPYPLDEGEQEQVGLYQTALTDYVKQNTLAFILGQRDLSEWDAYVSELEGQNLSAYMDIINGAHKRYQENNG
ncbi:extracellular solute-binding protein [Jonesia quinghaiensis]|uniref:ABC transporter substrate-binding protein n=1 Tax=Jonesia quinghaiensis TaxID=262806 RepID=UPI000407007A|nr:extracellular solute-binding protein [Jonesia quinghaiensis]